MNGIDMLCAKYHIARAKAVHAKAERQIKKADRHQVKASKYLNKISNRILAANGII